MVPPCPKDYGNTVVIMTCAYSINYVRPKPTFHCNVIGMLFIFEVSLFATLAYIFQTDSPHCGSADF